MRHILFVILLFVTVASKAGIHVDTLTYWDITYDKTTVIRGSLNTPSAPKYEVTIKDGSVKDITVSFVYDAVQPKSSSLVIKEKNEILRTVEGDPEMGPLFRVPVRELIGTHQPNVRYELDFYYSDDRGQKNLKLGTIIFAFK